jgi:hypothetical protein
MRGHIATREVDGTATAQPVAWYRLLDRHQWNTLLAANLWFFPETRGKPLPA